MPRRDKATLDALPDMPGQTPVDDGSALHKRVIELANGEQSTCGGKPAPSYLSKRAQDAELRVMRRMLALLDELPGERARCRVVEWLSDRYFGDTARQP